MANILKAACVQLNNAIDIQENLNAASALIRAAAGQGATFIATPENTDQMIHNRFEKLNDAFSEDEHPAVPFFKQLSQELGVWILVGSMCIRVDKDKLANRGFVFAPDGSISARYDKIHLFDVDLPTGESHRESKIYTPGDKGVVASIGDIKVGMSICYDLRFAHLYRSLAKAGAQILSIPAAFTLPTGQAHWEVLQRARAIETGCFVLAAAQCGSHDGARQTYGHSMIINPWGEILAELSDEPGFIVADLDLDAVINARSAIPALLHDRDYTVLGQ